MSDTTRTALEKIEAGIEAVRNSDRFREYLAFCGRFHKYSFANRILIWSQKPDAGLVAGFNTWKRLNRYVCKGEKGIMILAPMTGKRRSEAEEDEENEEQSFRYFKPVYVFDVSQTEGEDLPSPNQRLTGDDDGVWSVLETVARAEAISINREALPGQSANGFYVRSERRIWVSPDLEPLQAAKTLAHELSHHFAHHQEQGHSRDEAEMIAESSAFIVMSYLGKDSGDYSFGYLASWGDAKLFRQRLHEIHATAQELIGRIEAQQE